MALKHIEKGKPWLQYGEECHPKQRIFLSIDAIGSTKLKTSLAARGGTAGSWADAFTAFLPEVEVMYHKMFSDVVKKHCRGCSVKRCLCITSRTKNNKSTLSQDVNAGKSAEVWKYAGDEVILIHVLRCKKFQATLHVLALAKTIEYFNEEFSKKNFDLQFKGTAWVSGFPVTNMEIALKVSENQTVKDFLGPSIDLGFRLTDFASEERLVISASLAYLIVMAPLFPGKIEYRGIKESSIPLCSGGLVNVKGVITGKHPLIWLPLKNNEISKLCQVDLTQLKTYLETEYFLDKIPPFIFDSNDLDPIHIPNYDEYVKEYENAAREQKNILYSVFYIDQSTSAPPKKNKRIPLTKKQELDNTVTKVTKVTKV